MTGVALRGNERVAAPAEPDSAADRNGGRGAAGSGVARRSPIARLVAELALFAALGGLAIAQWSRLVTEAPVGGLLLALLITTAGAALLGLIGTSRLGWPLVVLLALAVAAIATAAAMVAVGLPARLLLPQNWAELIDNLSLGLAGIEDTEVPYAGSDEWLRQTLLLGAPLMLGLAAALGFWPARRRGLLRTLALGVLVAIYGIAVTLDSPGSELLWGILLLVLAAGWLWIPQLEPRRAALALAVAAGAGVLALPIASRLETGTPWLDYESWDWFARDREITFDWNHSYGPLEWPREGTTLLEVRSQRPLYWKASVLDRFDGFTWQRAPGGDALSAAERFARRRTPGTELVDTHREWLTQASFEIEALESTLVVGAGATQVVQGVGDVDASRDGTLSRAGDPLLSGDRYSILAYAPNPTASELRGAPSTYPDGRFFRQVLVALPASVPVLGDSGPTSSTAGPGAEAAQAGLEAGFAPSRARAMPLWGDRDPEVDAAFAASPYARTYELARRLTADAETPYDAVRAIERHLRTGYNYSPNVPNSTYPLAAFIEEDLAGYCQQFAGSMALMSRMVGIPSRVVSGFAPGSFDSERQLYEVRDFDAHSWVEVYFRGIGWVVFDPTPAAAPAASQTLNAELGLGSFFRGRGAALAQIQGRARSIERRLEGGAVPAGLGEDGGPWATVALVALGLTVLIAATATVVFVRRRRALAGGTRVDAQLEELRRALGRLGWSVPNEVTLLGIEQRFRRRGRRDAAGYAAGLRAHRYTPRHPAPPGPGERRALRRALAAGGGLRGWLRSLIAIPPGGPADRTR